MITIEKPNVLVVDDHEVNLVYIEKILHYLDINLIMALSGEDALKKISQRHLALALIDVEMPGMNGVELASVINRNRKDDLVPIIFITAYQFDDASLNRFYDYGIVDFIQKPFPVKILQKKAEIFLELDYQRRMLYESEKLFRTILNASPEGIIVTDLNGKMDQISEMTTNIFGSVQKNDLIGNELQCLFPNAERPRLAEIMKETLEKGMVRGVEFTMHKANMVAIICEISVTLIKGKDSNPMAYMIILRDITDRKHMEQKLIQTERMVVLGEMATGIAHEINQPLNILSFSVENILLELQNNHQLSPDLLARRSEKIFDSINRIGKIIDHVRYFSRDHHEYINSLFDVNESILNAQSMIAQQLSLRNIHVELLLDPHIPLVSGSTYKFEQVILNLLINAKDALYEKREMLSFDFDQVIEIKSFRNRQNVHVTITDNGSGIKHENLQKVMLPFFSTKVPGHGTGLGLSISYGIIKEMQGEIEITSVHGSNTQICITLPVNQLQEN
jgi:PAS domain S-box-containing protein